MPGTLFVTLWLVFGLVRLGRLLRLLSRSSMAGFIKSGTPLEPLDYSIERQER